MTLQKNNYAKVLCFVVLISLIGLASGQTNCNICGEGNVITLPDGQIQSPDDPDISVSCEQVQANSDRLPPEFCDSFPEFFSDTCGCIPLAQTGFPTFSPTANPTSLALIGLASDQTNCNICGEGNVITLPDGQIQSPDDPDISVSCEQVQANSDRIAPEFCDSFPEFFSDICGCIPLAQSTANPSSAPSFAPSLTPSSIPSDAPSDAPTRVPSFTSSTAAPMAAEVLATDPPSAAVTPWRTIRACGALVASTLLLLL